VFARCWIHRDALDDLHTEARRRLVRETGGALLGWSDKSEVVVRRILGPGPRATHGLSHFEPDADWQGERGREIYFASGRTIAYVGDWHTHPRGAPTPSLQDNKVMATIAGDPDFRAPHPVSAIVGRSWLAAIRRRPRELVVYIWDGRDLLPIDVVIFDGAVDIAPSAGPRLGTVRVIEQQ